MLINLQVILGKFIDAKNLSNKLLEENLDNFDKSVLYNNIGVNYFMGSEKLDKEKILENLKKALLFNEMT